MSRGKPTYIYLQLRVSLSAIIGWFKGECQTKIGISKYPKIRVKQNTKNMGGWFYNYFVRPVDDAKDLEQSLHKVYEDKNHRIKGNGGTEIFKLTWSDLRSITKRIKERAEGEAVPMSAWGLFIRLAIGLAFTYLLTMGQ